MRIAGQLSFAPGGGVLGIDMSVALKFAEALGYNLAAVAGLLPEAETGLLEGLARLKSEENT
ncbi:MAG: hypothetical protein HQL43_07030 [Alphaproteobacteria bacterium]|nr:hypothetical protein [Alphaproteobacteria bacterium]